jgi:hypothetical protein
MGRGARGRYVRGVWDRDRTGKSNVAALSGLGRLVDAGILTRDRNRKKGDSWEAKELFALLNAFETGVKDPAAAPG